MAQIIRRGIKQMMDEANEQVATLSVDELQSLLGADTHVIVDLRDIRELHRDGKIPGAFSCPRGMMEFWIDPESPYHKDIFNQDKSYVFYCASAWRSALSAQTAQNMGLKPVMHLAGGFKAWKAAGAPVEDVS